MTSTNDCLIWVGRSYPTIDDYVSEARQLGCCRQVPFWPLWLRKGSRVFLAHHGGRTKSAEGVVFGYFELGGVDVIFRPDDYKKLGGCRTPKAKIKFLRDRCPRGLPVHTKPATEDDANALADFIAGGFGLGCGGGEFGRGFSTEFTRLVRARDCPPDGLRCAPDDNADGHPSFYLVDELEREITEEFCELLDEVIEEMMKREHRKTRRDCLRKLAGEARASSVKARRQAGLPAFTKAMKSIDDRPHRGTPLRLFRKPYPMFVHRPHAWFRGLARIDGDDLLAQVAALESGSQGPVRIAYCGTKHAP